MPFPKLSPLQSRVAASLIASLTLLLLYFTFSSPHFAYATDVDSIRPEDHNHERLLDRPLLEVDLDMLESRGASYEAEFLGIDRGIIGRASTDNDPPALENNHREQRDISPGETVWYMFTNASLYGDKSTTEAFISPIRSREPVLEDEYEEYKDEKGVEKDISSVVDLRIRPRQSALGPRTLYISVTTCNQPQPVDSISPPQLQLYVSQSRNNTNPGPGKFPQDSVTLDSGYALYTLNATGDVFIGVYGNNQTKTSFQGTWGAEIAASIDAPYHYYHDTSDTNLAIVDRDSSSALLLADNPMKFDGNGTNWEKWMNIGPPFVLFGSSTDNQFVVGLEKSYCGLKNYAQMGASMPGLTTNNVQTVLKRETGKLPKQQFYMHGLTGTSKYSVILAMDGNSTASGVGVVGGGGQVFREVNFTTLSDSNCAVIFNLSFCDKIEYSVPANPNNFPNASSLAAFYDNYTQSMYGYFEKVLAQTPCETTSSAQYSLARTCDDCRSAYKEWLCAVTIPRCTDFSSTVAGLQNRAMGQPFPNGTALDPATLKFVNTSAALNNSRNPNIDQFVTPGPYKEVLPCDQLCHHIVQSCPASMGFDCPGPGDIGFNESYGITPTTQSVADGSIPEGSCNYPGKLQIAVGNRVLQSSLLVASTVIIMGLMLV